MSLSPTTKPARAAAIASQLTLVAKPNVTDDPGPASTDNTWPPLMPVHIHSPSTPNTNTPACALTPTVPPASHPLTEYFPESGVMSTKSDHSLWPKPYPPCAPI